MQCTDLGSHEVESIFIVGEENPVKMDINQKKILNMYRKQKVIQACFGRACVPAKAL